MSDDFPLRSWDDLRAACKNIGFDIDCGACAALFFTGFGAYDHAESCQTVRPSHDDVFVGHVCKTCQGTGQQTADWRAKCLECSGIGYIEVKS